MFLSQMLWDDISVGESPRTLIHALCLGHSTLPVGVMALGASLFCKSGGLQVMWCIRVVYVITSIKSMRNESSLCVGPFVNDSKGASFSAD